MKDDPENNDGLLARWLHGELSEEELKLLEQEEGKEALDQLREVAEASSGLAPPPFDREASRNRLMAAIAEEEQEAEVRPLHPPVEASRPAAQTRRNPWVWYAIGGGIAAAIVILVLFVIPSGSSGEMVELFADGGKLLSAELPDGSKVELNAGSRLSYPQAGWEADREVQLTGEAYFKVAKGKRFRVATESGLVDVLGTRFRVAPGEDQALLVTCYSGKVGISNPEGKQLEAITQGETATLKGGQVTTASVEDEVPDWAVREFSFEGDPVPEVVKVIEEEFDVAIEAAALEGKKFSGSFSNRKLKAALDILVQTFGMSWKETGKGQYTIM